MFPCLISIPHGGTKIPEEVKDLILISERDILEDGDAFVQELYSVEAVSIVKTDIARAFVDPNRAPDDLPPENPDGVVKTYTCFGKKVYRKFPERKTIERLLEKYYYPYHRRIKEELKREKVLIAFDCHSMAPTPPSIAPDTGKRPLICLGDYHGRACPPALTELLAECFREVFRFPRDKVKINEPFAGGYITQTYGMNPKPWIQIEINRELYMDWKELRKDERKLSDVRGGFRRTLSLFFERANL